MSVFRMTQVGRTKSRRKKSVFTNSRRKFFSRIHTENATMHSYRGLLLPSAAFGTSCAIYCFWIFGSESYPLFPNLELDLVPSQCDKGIRGASTANEMRFPIGFSCLVNDLDLGS